MKCCVQGLGKMAVAGAIDDIRHGLVYAANSLPSALLCAAGLLVLAADSQAQYAGGANTSAPVTGSEYSIASAGPNERVWRKITAETNSLGRVINHVHSFKEVGTGLNYLEGGQFAAASDAIDITQNGGAAAHTQHKTTFAANLHTCLQGPMTPAEEQLWQELEPEIEPALEKAEAGIESFWDKAVDFFSNKANQAQVNQGLGRAAENATDLLKNTQRIPSLNNTACYRIPDLLEPALKLMGDTKNVQYLST